MSNRNPLFAALLLAAVAQHAKEQNLPGFGGGIGGPGMDGPKPINRKPLSRKLECPDCGQEVVLVRSLTDGVACIDVHFLMEDGDHMVAGLLFPSVVDRDTTFLKMTYEDTKAIFAEMLGNSVGGFADLLGGLGRTR